MFRAASDSAAALGADDFAELSQSPVDRRRHRESQIDMSHTIIGGVVREKRNAPRHRCRQSASGEIVHCLIDTTFHDASQSIISLTVIGEALNSTSNHRSRSVQSTN